MKFYTKQEVCDILHLSMRTFVRYCKEGKIKYFRVANKVLVSHDDLQEFIEAERQKMLSQSQKETA